jgi:hypothetical protein
VADTALSLRTQALSNALWALAVLEAQPEPAVLGALVSRAQQLLPAAASPQALSNLLWAMAKLRYDPGPAFVAASVSRALVLADALRCGGARVAGACTACRAAATDARARCCCRLPRRAAAGPRT